MAIIGTEREKEIRQGTETGVQPAPHSRSLDTRGPHDVTLFTFKASLSNRSPSAVPVLEDGDLEKERERDKERDRKVKRRGKIRPKSPRELQGLQGFASNFSLSLLFFVQISPELEFSQGVWLLCHSNCYFLDLKKIYQKWE